MTDSSEEYHTIEMTDLERRMYEKHTETRRVYLSMDNVHGSYQVWLNVGVQHFQMHHECDSIEEAEWYRMMLGKALAAVVMDLAP